LWFTPLRYATQNACPHCPQLEFYFSIVRQKDQLRVRQQLPDLRDCGQYALRIRRVDQQDIRLQLLNQLKVFEGRLNVEDNTNISHVGEQGTQRLSYEHLGIDYSEVHTFLELSKPPKQWHMN
jgi:hypothetical protein